MNETPNYSEFHPRWHRTHLSTYWWLSKWAYTKFMLREISSVFVAIFVVLTLLEIQALSQGAQAFQVFQEWLGRPLIVVLNVVSFLFILLHTITWFNLTPRAMAVRFGGRRVPDMLVIIPNYVAWLVISGVIAWIVLGG